MADISKLEQQTENKMKDSDIIKGLECCQTEYERKCKECPYSRFKKHYITIDTCSSRLRADLLQLIKRLSTNPAEIRWLLHADGSGTCQTCGFTQKAVWDMEDYQLYCNHCGAKVVGAKFDN